MMIEMLIAAAVLFALAMLGLGLGMLIKGKPLHAGCCGKGEHPIGPDGKELRCDGCPDRGPAGQRCDVTLP